MTGSVCGEVATAERSGATGWQRAGPGSRARPGRGGRRASRCRCRPGAALPRSNAGGRWGTDVHETARPPTSWLNGPFHVMHTVGPRTGPVLRGPANEPMQFEPPRRGRALQEPRVLRPGTPPSAAYLRAQGRFSSFGAGLSTLAGGSTGTVTRQFRSRWD